MIEIQIEVYHGEGDNVGSVDRIARQVFRANYAYKTAALLDVQYFVPTQSLAPGRCRSIARFQLEP